MMKNFKVIIFCFSLYFNAVKLFEYDKRNQMEFLQKEIEEKKYWESEYVQSKEALMDGKRISLNKLFQELNVKTLHECIQTEENVNKLSNVMINFLACEYAQFSYYLIKYLEQIFIDRSEVNMQLIDFDRIQLLPTLISEMIFTQSNFMNFRINSEYNEQKLLKILLSFYLQFTHNEFMDLSQILVYSKDENVDEKQIKIKKYLAGNKIVAFQLTNSLEEFLIQNCLRHGDLKNFKLSFVNHGNDTIWEAIRQRLDMYFKGIESPKVITQSQKRPNEIEKRKIFNDNNEYNRFLNTMAIYLNITVKWNNEESSLKEIFEKYIKNGTDIQNIVKYEQLVLDMKTELVYKSVVEELYKTISDRGYNQRLYETCSTIIENVNSYLKSSKLSVIFVNKIQMLLYKLSLVILGLKSFKTFNDTMRIIEQMKNTDKISRTLDNDWKLGRSVDDGNLKMHDHSSAEKNDSETTRFFTLSVILSNKRFEFFNQTYLNTDILDLFYDSSLTNIAGIFDHTFDSANVITDGGNKLEHSTERKENGICAAVDNAINAARIVYSRSCYESNMCYLKNSRMGYTYPRNPKVVLVHQLSVTLKYRLIKMLLAAYNDKQFFDIAYRLRKLLLTFFFNEENVLMYNSTTYWTQNGLHSLLNFHFQFLHQITEYYNLMCDAPLTPVVTYNLSSEAISFLTKNNTDLENYVVSAYRIVNDIEDIDLLKEDEIINTRPIPTDPKNEISFNVIGMYNQFISTNIDVFHGSQIKFYWKQNALSMKSIQTEFAFKTFNLQDVIEYQLLTVKWIISSMFSTFLIVLDGTIHYDFANEKLIKLDCFVRQLKYLYPLLNGNSILFKRTLLIFESFNDVINAPGCNNLLIDLKNVIFAQLKLFGVVVTSLPSLAGKIISEHVNNVCNNVTALENSNFSSLFKSVGLSQLLPDIPTMYTRFEE